MIYDRYQQQNMEVFAMQVGFAWAIYWKYQQTNRDSAKICVCEEGGRGG